MSEKHGVTNSEAESFLSLFFDLEFLNEKMVIEDEDKWGKKLKITRLQCIIPSKNARKYYHITLYEKGFIAHYGRLDEKLRPKGQQQFSQHFDSQSAARWAFDEKVSSKTYPPSGKDRYTVVETEIVK